MEIAKIQSLLATKFEGDYTRTARMAHFVGLLKTGVDGLASLGVVVTVEAEGLDGLQPLSRPANALESLESAIEHMVRASHAAN